MSGNGGNGARTTLAQAFRQGLHEEMSRDESVFVMGTDLYVSGRGGHFGQVKGFGEEFGEARIRDTPISEAAMAAAGVGAALTGMRPLVEFNFIDFAFGAVDEIVNQAAKIRHMTGVPVPVVFRGTGGAALFAAQHNNSTEAMFAQVPGLVVVMPATPADARGLIRTALRADDPVVFLMHKKLSSLRGPLGDPQDLVPLGSARIRRTGRHATVVGFGITVGKALTAADNLAAEGVELEVIDLRSLYPLDMETVAASVRSTGRAIVVTEEPSAYGIGAEVAAAVQRDCFAYLDAPVERVASQRVPIPHSPPLIEAIVPQADGIEAAVRSSLADWPPTPPLA